MQIWTVGRQIRICISNNLLDYVDTAGPLTTTVVAWFWQSHDRTWRKWCQTRYVLGSGSTEAKKIRCFFLFSVSNPCSTLFSSFLPFSSQSLTPAVQHEELEWHAAGGDVSGQHERFQLLHPDIPGRVPHCLWPSRGWGPEDQVPQLVWGQQLQSPLWRQWHWGGCWNLLWQFYKWVSLQTRAPAPAHLSHGFFSHTCPHPLQQH